MDWMDAFWPDDLSQVQLGTVSQWVSAILSSVSIILAMYIIVRDHRAKRTEQVSRLIIRRERVRMAKRVYEDDITFTNRSDSDIFINYVCACGYDTTRIRAATEFRIALTKVISKPRSTRLKILTALRTGGMDTWWLHDEAKATVSVLKPADSAKFRANLEQYKHSASVKAMFLGVWIQDAAGLHWLIEARTNTRFEGEQSPWLDEIKF